jgi:hypothetical protein
VGANPQGIGSKRAAVGPVCVGTVDRGGFNDCSAPAVFAIVTSNGSRLCVLGACDRHVLRAKYWMAEHVSEFGEVLITTPEALEAELRDDEHLMQVVPRRSTA